MALPALQFLAATQETTDGGETWSTVGAIEVVDADPRATAADVAHGFAAEAEDTPDVRVAIWNAPSEPGDELDLASPDVRITHRDLVGAGNTKRRAGRRNRGPAPRVNGPIGEVNCRYAADDRLFKRYVLVTNDPANRQGEQQLGAEWYPAAGRDGAVKAYVTGTGRVTLQGKEIFSLHFKLNGLPLEARMKPGEAVIVEDDAA